MRYKLLKQKASFMSLIIICAVFSIYLINPVSAEDTAAENMACCEKTTGGETCRYTTADKCDSSFDVGSFQKCEDTTFCKPGCCVSPEGTCSRQVSKGACENAGDLYQWDVDATCSMEKCQKGCCVLGGVECAFTTDRRCADMTSAFEGLEKDFRDAVGSEAECIDVCKQADDGCCARSDGTCQRTTRAACGLEDGVGGDGFYKDVFCSNDQLKCDPKCVPHGGGKHCVEGLEDVYWFDSCGNREEGVTDTIEWSENLPQKNGDCDYARGTICSEKLDAAHTTAYCKSVNCKKSDLETEKYSQNTYTTYPELGANDRARYNGESWCVYDSKPGPGMDTVGSRHWRHICVNGEEVVEPCRDFREEICTQLDIENIPPDASLYRESGCVPNTGKSCSTECNTAKESETEAEKTAATRADKKCCESPSRNCQWQWADEPKNTTGICMASIPPGIQFWEDAEGNVDEEAKAVCNAWSTEEKAYWQENAVRFVDAEGNRRWDCTSRCEMYTAEYLNANNLLCNTAGDCGAKYNYLGTWNNEAYYREWDKDAPSDTDTGAGMRDTDFPVKKNIEPSNLDDSYKWESLISNIEKGLYRGAFDYKEIRSQETWTGGDYSAWATAWAFTGMFLITYVGFAIAIAALAGSAATIGSFFTLGISTVAASELSGLAAVGSAAGGVSWVPILGWVVAGIMAIVMAVMLALIYSAASEERTVTTTCEPWIAPAGGSSCAECDADPIMHPCSEYRCRSLGKQCRFIPENEGTTKGTCYAEDRNDVNKPKIKPWYYEGTANNPLGVWVRESGIRVDKHTDYTTNPIPVTPDQIVDAGYEINEKLPSFSTIEFGIKTEDKASQCKYSTTFNPGMAFATAENWFGDSYYSKWHNMTIYGLLPNKTYEYYVICKGVNGYPKDDETTPPYKIMFSTGEGPDLEPPAITSAEPANNGYIKAGADATAALCVDEVSPYECRMSNADVDYSLMETSLICVRRAPESHTSGTGPCFNYGMCVANISEMQVGPNTFYVRCRDNPEFGPGTPNTMDESYAYTITESEPLEINNIVPPAGTVYYTRNVTLQVLTAKGAFGGRAICSYAETPAGSISGEFFDTNSTQHTQTFTEMARGAYNLQIDCFDEVENTATAVTNFTVEADTISPNVIALYKDASGLHLTLDEKASCQYKGDSFSYGSGTQASGESETAAFPISAEGIHIRCIDAYGNIMPEIIVRADIS